MFDPTFSTQHNSRNFLPLQKFQELKQPLESFSSQSQPSNKTNIKEIIKRSNTYEHNPSVTDKSIEHTAKITTSPRSSISDSQGTQERIRLSPQDNENNENYINVQERDPEKLDLSDFEKKELQKLSLKLDNELQTRRLIQKANAGITLLFFVGVLVLSFTAPFSLIAVIGSVAALAVLCTVVTIGCKIAFIQHTKASHKEVDVIEIASTPSSLLEFKRIMLSFLLNKEKVVEGIAFTRENIIKSFKREGRIPEWWRKHRWKVRSLLGVVGLASAIVSVTVFPPLAIVGTIFLCAFVSSYVLPKSLLFYKTGYFSFDNFSKEREVFRQGIDPSANKSVHYRAVVALEREGSNFTVSVFEEKCSRDSCDSREESVSYDKNKSYPRIDLKRFLTAPPYLKD